MLLVQAKGKSLQTLTKAARADRASVTARLLPLAGLGLLALAISIVAAHGVQRQFLNADHIMYSIMSLDKVTLFYWQQNRFLSVIPLLASPITNPYLNLVAVTMLSALSHLLCLALLFAVSRNLLLGRTVTIRELVPGILLFWGLTTALVRPEALYTMLQHHEYSLAISLLLGAWLILQRIPVADSPIAKFGAGLFAIFLLAIALGVNPSMIVIGFALTLVQIVIRGGWQGRILMSSAWLLALAITFAAWYLIMSGQDDEERYFSVRWADIPLGIQLGVSAFVNQFETLAVIPLLVVMIGLAAVSSRGREWSLPQKSTRAAALIAVTVSIIWLFGFSTIEWVFVNDHHARYFTPASYVLLLLCALSLSALLKHRFESSRGQIKLLGLALVSALLLKAPVSSNLLNAPVFESLPSSASRSLILAGDYWKVWPQYFLLKTQGETPVSLASRSKAIAGYFRGELKGLLALEQPVVAWCMNAKRAVCKRQVDSYLQDAAVSGFTVIDSQLAEFSISWQEK